MTSPLGKKLPVPREMGYTLPSEKAYPSLGKRGIRNWDKGTRASEKGIPVPAKRSSDTRNRATGLRRNGVRHAVTADPSLVYEPPVPREMVARPSENGRPVSQKEGTTPSEKGYPFPS